MRGDRSVRRSCKSIQKFQQWFWNNFEFSDQNFLVLERFLLASKICGTAPKSCATGRPVSSSMWVVAGEELWVDATGHARAFFRSFNIVSSRTRFLSMLMPMFFLTFGYLVIFGKLWEARSRLYRRQSLQVNTRLKKRLRKEGTWTWKLLTRSTKKRLHIWNPIENHGTFWIQ